MKRCFGLSFALALLLLISSAVYAQDSPPAGVVAFAGTDAAGTASLYVLDLASGRTGQVIIPVGSDPDLDWHPEGEMLAFTTQDGAYGLLRSLRGCFDAAATCADSVEVVPPFLAEAVEWLPDGETLMFLTDEGLKSSPPRGRPAEIVDLELSCPNGVVVSGAPLFLLCAAEDNSGDIMASVYQVEDAEFMRLYDLGTFPGITAFDIGPVGRSAVGTQETAGYSGFYAPESGGPVRLATYQINIYDLEFSPDGSQIVIVGATSDATGDGTLGDGDPAELFLYDTTENELEQIPGFTNATAATWAPDGRWVLAVIDHQSFRMYDTVERQDLSVNAAMPQTDLQIVQPAWSPAVQVQLPNIPVATPGAQATPIPSPTSAASLTPPPTLTPFPTFTPWPTATSVPTATPGSPVGVGCQYAYGTTMPVAVGDTAEVTPYGAAVRFRAQAALSAALIRELLPGTRLTILSGPYCGDGYRWWQARLESDGRIGYLADSDPTGLWIQKVTVPPTPRPESISFYADRYTIAPGECATIRWDVEGIKEVYFNNQGVTGHDARTACLAVTSTFTLRIVRVDNTELTQTLTIVVTPAP